MCCWNKLLRNNSYLIRQEIFQILFIIVGIFGDSVIVVMMTITSTLIEYFDGQNGFQIDDKIFHLEQHDIYEV